MTALLSGVALTGCTTELQVTTSPALFPAFNPAITDYVVRCDPSTPIQVNIDTPSGTSVSVAGQPATSGTFSVKVTRNVGQSFTIVSTASSGTSTYYLRCLPADFPTWSSTHTGTTQAEWYVLAVPLSFLGQHPNPYVAIFDTNGVPVWWKADHPLFGTYFANGNVAWTTAGAAQERRLDGSLVRVIDTVGARNDFHELERLANGNYLMAANVNRSGVDLTSIGGPASVTMVDPVIQEFTPAGSLVWSWSTLDHIPVSESDPQWRTQANQAPYDVYHFNSIGADGSGRVLVSYRHLDAVFDIDKATGQIVYKLGGSPRPESLSVVGDPVLSSSGFGGQHDARVLPDGTITIHDNGSNKNRAPRAVRYRINLSAAPHTATLLEQITDPAAPSSACCGSARKLPGGNWVMSWGGQHEITELTPSGTRVFDITLNNEFSYRAVPLPFGQLSRQALRAGMDVQHPF